MADKEEADRWVRRAQAGDIDAFGQVVRRYQDMAVGYAAAILGDFHLGQDAAQEAFVEAYRNLAALRAPEAFPGWLRTIVFKHCDRFRRGKQVRTSPLETAVEAASPEPGPDEILQRREDRESVRAAIRSLPVEERTVTMLFYINEYSQREIAAFLGVSVITVKKRLATARKELKERMISMMQDDLRARRPSNDDAFTERVLAFTRRFSELIEQGTSLVRSLNDLAERQEDRDSQEAIRRINQELQEGNSLSRAMGLYPDFFSDNYIKAVQLGEYTGTLDVFLRRMAAGAAIDADAEASAVFTLEPPSFITGLAERLIGLAIERGAEEAHLVSDGRELRLFFHIGGRREAIRSYPGFLRTPLFARYRTLAGISPDGDTQEGQMRFALGEGLERPVTVSFRATPNGEKLVLSFIA